MKYDETHSKKKWKVFFITLLAINLAVLLLIIGLILWPVSSIDTTPTANKSQQLHGSEFTIQTTKKNLNELVNAYVHKFLEDTNHQYQVILDEDVHLVGDLPVFSTTVPLSIRMEPIVLEDGNLILRQKSISLGHLQLPNRKILQYTKKHLPMPEWVVVNPKEEEVYVAITEMEIKSNFRVSVSNFDLEANHLAFKIIVPYETLGIDMPAYTEPSAK